MSSKLKKSKTEKMISGVCGGIASYLGWDPTIIRIIFIICAILGYGSPILIYFILAIAMPD